MDSDERLYVIALAVSIVVITGLLLVAGYFDENSNKYYKGYDYKNEAVDLSNWEFEKVDAKGNILQTGVNYDKYYWSLSNDNTQQTIDDAVNYPYGFPAYTGAIVDGKIIGEVPAYINDIPVISINCAFVSLNNLEEQPIIPDTVIYADEAFRGSGLESIGKIPDSVKSGVRMYANCNNLTSVEISLSDNMEDLSYAFCENDSLLKLVVNVPSNKTDISYLVTDSMLTDATINLNYTDTIIASKIQGLDEINRIKINASQDMKDEYKVLDKYSIKFKTKWE